MSVTITYTMPDGSRVVITNVSPEQANVDVVPDYESKAVKGLPDVSPEAEADFGVEEDGWRELATEPVDTEALEANPWPDEDVPSVQPLSIDQPMTAAAPGKAVPALVRGAYTFLFSILGMVGAAVTYLRDNLSQITEFKWEAIAIVVGAAVLAGIGYGLKKYFKPDGVL